MFAPPLQIVDSFLLKYNVGDALILVFVLGLLATLPLRSRKITTLHLMLFGLVFMLTPTSVMTVDAPTHILGSALQYKMLGLGLLIVGPVLYATAGASGSDASEASRAR